MRSADETMIRGKSTFWLKKEWRSFDHFEFRGDPIGIHSRLVCTVAVAVSAHHQLITLTFTDKIPNLNNNVGMFNK